MKVTVDIDCTPVEARQFFGLPDITLIQEKIMEAMEEQMLEQLRSLDTETFVNTWMPVNLQNLEEMQKMFWTQMGKNLDPKGESGKETVKKKK